MKRLTLALLGTVLVIGSACADPGADILVTGHVPMEGTLDEESGLITDCSMPTEIGDTLLAQDVFINLEEIESAGTGFTLGLLMENRLDNSATYAPIGEDKNQRLDQNHIEIQTYEVVFDSSGFDNLGSGGDIAYEATGILPTDGTLYAGVTLFYPNEIPDWRNAFAIAAGGAGGAIVPTFAEVQVRGRTIGGSKVQSNRLTIPIQVCDGCARSSTPICVATE